MFFKAEESSFTKTKRLFSFCEDPKPPLFCESDEAARRLPEEDGRVGG